MSQPYWDDTTCGAKWRGYECMRYPEHSGEHVEYDEHGFAVAEWEADDPADDYYEKWKSERKGERR